MKMATFGLLFSIINKHEEQKVKYKARRSDHCENCSQKEDSKAVCLLQNR